MVHLCQRLGQPFVAGTWLTVLLCCTSGCLATKVRWYEPVEAPPRVDSSRCSQLRHTEEIYEQALCHEQQGDASCVDLMFQVAIATRNHEVCDPARCRGSQLHRSALFKLVDAGQRFGRLDPRHGLKVYRGGEETVIPIVHRGFVWQADDFHHLVVVGDYKTNAVTTKHRQQGVGIPLVVKSCKRCCQSLLPDESFFAATIRIDAAEDGEGIELHLYDPLRIDHVLVEGNQCAITKDLTAPLAYRLRNDQRTILSGFIDDSTEQSRLAVLEPYQRGKIPVVLIHGLLSDPFTWAEMANELRARPGFVDCFQLWVFEYSTGRAFVTSAARLREQLAIARQQLDPRRQDPEFEQMVLIGHSMGGLIAKLQVTASGDTLWRSVANRPIDQVVMEQSLRNDLSGAFFFRPSNDVSRVVFMATPHRGSSYARRVIGRFGSMLVEIDEQRRREHEQLIACNPGVFSEEVSNRIPTSIDLLDPDSQLLQAIDSLPIGDRVCVHSIIGDHCCSLFHGRSDGVVPVSSARHPRSNSERFVRATHSKVKDKAESIEEVLSILSQHARTIRQNQIRPAILHEDLDATQLTAH